MAASRLGNGAMSLGVAAEYSVGAGLGKPPAFLGVLSDALGAGSILWPARR